MRPTSSLFILLTFLSVTSCIISTKKSSNNSGTQLSSAAILPDIVTTESSSSAKPSLSAPATSTHHSSHSSIATMVSSSFIQNSLNSSDSVLSSSSITSNLSSVLSTQGNSSINTSSTTALSSPIVSSSSQTQELPSDDLYALREIVETKQKLFKTLYESLDGCTTAECIRAKAEYDIASLDLKGAVKTGVFSSSYRTHQQLKIGVLTSTRLRHMSSDFTCENGSTGSSYREFNYSISKGSLELVYDDYCIKEHYIGSSTDLFGTWELIQTEEFNPRESGNSCWWDWHDHRTDTHKTHKTLIITPQQITIDEQIDYNCLYDDFLYKWNDELEFTGTKVDCNTYSFEEGDGLMGYATNERIDGSFIASYRYEYEDQSCSWANERNVNDTTDTVCTSDLPKKLPAERPCTDFFESFCIESQSTLNRCKYLY